MYLELRYPFFSMFEFYKSFLFRSEAIHLVLAHILIASFIVYFIRKVRDPLFASASLYVVLSVARNPSFSLGFGDIAEVFAALFFGITLRRIYKKEIYFRLRLWHFITIIFLGLVSIHSMSTFLIYEIGNNAEFMQRCILLTRLFVTFFIMSYLICAVRENQERQQYLKMAIISIVCVASLTYLIQFVFLFGLKRQTFGTFSSAGFGGMRFASIALEGGHLARFLVPMFISFFLLKPKRWEFFLVLPCLLIFFLNVSASGYILALTFFLSLVGFSLLYRFPRFNRYFFISALLFGLLISASFLMVYSDSPTLQGLSEKVQKAFRVMTDPLDDVYGRSPVIIPHLLKRAPLGFGYGGSTQRDFVLRSITEMYSRNNHIDYHVDLGLNALVSQISLLALPLIFSLAFLWLRFMKFARNTKSIGESSKVICLAALTTFVAMFLIDILWATPLIWMIPVLCYALYYKVENPIQPYSEAA